MAMSSKGVMQRLEMSVDRQLLAEMVARAVSVTILIEVGDVWAGRRSSRQSDRQPNAQQCVNRMMLQLLEI